MFHAFTLTATVLLPLYTASPIVIVKSIMPFSNVIKQTLLRRVGGLRVGCQRSSTPSQKSQATLSTSCGSSRIKSSLPPGGAPLPADTLERMRRKFKRAVLLEGYGLSECSPVVSVNLPNKQKPMSVGPPLPDYEVKVVDEELIELPLQERGRGDHSEGRLRDEGILQEPLRDGEHHS
ncbi:MAG: AMP-binding protein [Aquificota bacterium]|nr:AMP-binding protein [Aquificota bacterium]